MDDREFEQHLRRYRPAAPAAELRDVVLGGAGPTPDRAHRRASLETRSTWWQLAAAAVLLLTTIVLHAATERIDRRIALATAPAREAEQRRLDELARELGSDRSARVIARLVLVRERVRSRNALSAREIPQ